jgi:Uma2 family endonuclease
MMAQALTKERLMTVEEYLAFEEKSKIKHEYMDGEIFAMAGVKRNHSLANTNISTELNLQLRDSDCEVHISDFRVRVRETHFVYPDVAVACGEIDVETSGEIETLINPLVIFEVLSKSTEKRDRGEKAEDYFKISSLRDYILVSQNRMRVEHFHRESDNKWSLIIYEKPEDVLILDSINCKLTLRQIYLKINFPNLKVMKSKKNGR